MSAERAPQPTPAEVAAAKKKSLEDVDKDAQEYVEGQTAAQDTVQRGYDAADTVRGTTEAASTPGVSGTNPIEVNFSNGIDTPMEYFLTASGAAVAAVALISMILGFTSKRLHGGVK